LVSFEKFAIQNAPQIFSNKWKSQLHLLKSDTVWIKRFGWLSPNKNLISQEISQFIKANSNDILFELKKAVLLRLVDDNNYYSTTLKIDPEIIYAEKLLQKPETIAIILKSKNKK
jgi:hypothetical protein